jgi:uncharacterized protein (DUF58 family)
MTESLLAPEFLRELEILKQRLDIEVRSGGAGERASRRKGGSAEFAEHRPYEPGDDLRRIDWLAFARSGQPMTKLFRAEEDALVRLCLDASQSLDVGEPSKFSTAQRVAAAIGYIALAQGQRTELAVARVDEPGGRPVKSRGRARRGRSGITTLLRELAVVTTGGATDLAGAIRAITEGSSRPGLLVVLSDFFDPGPVLESLGLARALGHEVALIQILDRSELDPNLEGDLALEDVETGSVVEISADPAAISAYLQRLRALCDGLRRWARRQGATYLLTTPSESLPVVMRRFVSRSID